MNKLKETYLNFDNQTQEILKKGLTFCFILSMISGFILLTYHLSASNPFVYHLGLSLFKLSLIFSCEFIICSFVVEGIKKEMI